MLVFNQWEKLIITKSSVIPFQLEYEVSPNIVEQ